MAALVRWPVTIGSNAQFYYDREIGRIVRLQTATKFKTCLR